MKLKMPYVLSYTLMFMMLFVSTSCLNQGETPKIPGIDGPNLNIVDGKILLSVGLENIDLPGALTLPIPKLKNSTVTLGTRFQGGTMIQIAFDLNDVESDRFRVVPSQTMPDGRAFPFIMGGELPALAFNIPKAFDMTFYASKRAFGFFLPLKLPSDFQIGGTIALKINGKQFGVFSVVGNNGEGEGSGLVLMLTLEQIRSNPDVKTLLKFSKKRRFKNKVF
jgi:hypothetical protein